MQLRKRKDRTNQDPLELPPEPEFQGALDSMDEWEDTPAPAPAPREEVPIFRSAPRPAITPPPREPRTHPANIGESVHIKGELTGHEDITIEGRVEGRISMEDCSVTIGRTGNVTAEICARSVIVEGKVVGNVLATDKVEITRTGSLEGDITASRVALAEGSRFKGSIDMGENPPPPPVEARQPKAKRSRPEPEPEVQTAEEPRAEASEPEPEATDVKHSTGDLSRLF